MGKISTVLYEKISEDNLTTKKAGEYYYLYNMLGKTLDIDHQYIEYETDQFELRNRIIRNAVSTKTIPNHPKVDNTILGISSLHNYPVIVVEY